MRQQGRIALGFLLAICGLVVWYIVAADYDYGALAGIYSFHNGKLSSTLILRANRTFHQEVSDESGTNAADGTWRRIGEGGVTFSPTFLRLPGAKTFSEEFRMSYGNVDDSAFYGHFEKIAGVYPLLKLNSNLPGPTLYRRLF